MMDNPETKMEVEIPYELLKDDQKNQLGKNNEAKMTLYNALPRNSQVKDCKVDLLIQQYEKFSISSEETINSGFTRFNVIVTSLKSLDQDYSSKNHVRKFLSLFFLINGDTTMTTLKKQKLHKEKVKVVASKANMFEEGYAVTISETKAVKAQDKGRVATIAVKKVTSLVSVQILKKIKLLSNELGAIAKMVMNLKMMLIVSWRLTLKRLQDEAMKFSKFKKSSVVLDDMLSHQKLSTIRKVLDFLRMRKPLLTPPVRQWVVKK
ncbi:hypothetical protein Tco_1041161 [Tanacetum coccineum]|uniref:Uncharacterized protein n=1 Tax=Tanacetum coccineum TaxID=301880 RepID=A0ABQ5GG32_9ASTR